MNWKLTLLLLFPAFSVQASIHPGQSTDGMWFYAGLWVLLALVLLFRRINRFTNDRLKRMREEAQSRADRVLEDQKGFEEGSGQHLEFYPAI